MARARTGESCSRLYASQRDRGRGHRRPWTCCRRSLWRPRAAASPFGRLSSVAAAISLALLTAAGRRRRPCPAGETALLLASQLKFPQNRGMIFMFSLATHFALGPHRGTHVQGAPYINNVVACIDISVRRARLISSCGKMPCSTPRPRYHRLVRRTRLILKPQKLTRPMGQSTTTAGNPLVVRRVQHSTNLLLVSRSQVV